MLLRSGLVLILLLNSIAPLFAQAKAGPTTSGDIAITNVNVIPMDRERTLPNQTIIVRNGLISDLGPAGKIKIPANTVRIDGRGKYVIPGLVDSHTHLYSTTEMPLYITNGVTTVFDLNGRPPHLLWKKKIAAGELLGPTVFACGPKFDSVRIPDEAAAEVERQFKAGYDGVKIYVRVSKEELPSLTAAARSHNMIIVGHAVRRAGFEATVNAGQSIAHAEEYLYSFFNAAKDPANPMKVEIKLDESRIPEAVLLTKKAGISVIPTLMTYDHIVRQITGLDEYLKRPEFKYLSPPQWEALQPDRNRYKTRFRPEAGPEMRRNLEFQKKLVKALHEAGVPIIAGTDSVGVGPVPGFSLHEELQMFVSIGFSPYESLRTATSGASEFLKSPDRFGTIAVGKRADMLLLAGNPLEEISNTSKIEGLVIRGKYLSKAQLAAKLEALPGDYKAEVEKMSGLLDSDTPSALAYLNDNDPFGQLTGVAISSFAQKNGVEKLKELLARVKQRYPESNLGSEEAINDLGYSLLRAKKLKDAINIFQVNVDLYPESANVYDSLAEAYMENGDKELAIKFYKKTLEMNPKNDGAVRFLQRLQQP